MGWLKRIDSGLARGEGAIAAAVLLSMIALAATQAILYNLSTRFAMGWANDALAELDWIDSFLQKGTLWLAFLGASLATYDGRHIAVDALSRVLPARLRDLVRAVVTLAAATTCFYLSRVFYVAALRAQDRPLDYEVLTASGSVHICNAPLSMVASAHLHRPDVFCAMRWGLARLGIHAAAPDGTILQVQTPFGMLELIVPVLLLLMALRFLGRSLGTARSLVADEPAETALQPAATADQSREAEG